jgi:hypothetical protein
MNIVRFSVVGCLAVSACTAPANPPSLLPRAIETRSDRAPSESSPIMSSPISPALASKLAALVTEARLGDADFASADRSSATALAAGRNAPTGSESWIAAEIAISALQVARQRSAGALADVDTLAVNQGELASRDATTSGLLEIQSAQAEIEAIVARQTARLNSLGR